MKVKWLDEVAAKDYEAAVSYLSLRISEAEAQTLRAAFAQAPIEWRRANDILRAAELAPAPHDDPGVRKDRRKIKKGKRLSPILVVSYEFGSDIADGFHRASAVYHDDPYLEIPLKVAHSQGRRP